LNDRECRIEREGRVSPSRLRENAAFRRNHRRCGYWKFPESEEISAKHDSKFAKFPVPKPAFPFFNPGPIP
jgi:hypothetical protein